MQVRPIRTRVFKEGEDLVDFIARRIKRLPEKSVLVVTSKIVALAEGRVVDTTDRTVKERIIKEESDVAIKTKYVWLTVKNGNVLPSAGIDESNADGKLILLPKDSQRSAEKLRKDLMRRYRVKKLGVVIPDSRTLPLRSGVVGTALGWAGLRAIRDYRGTKDIFGRAFHYSRTNVVDCVASAAVLVMGEGNEQQPLALVTNAPVEFVDRSTKSEVMIPLEDDMFLPFLSKLVRRKGK